MKSIRIIYFLIIVLVVMFVTAGCEDSGITESPDLTQELMNKQAEAEEQLAERLERIHNLQENQPGLAHPRTFDELPPGLRDRIKAHRRVMKESQEPTELPEEIVRAWEEFHEDVKEFFGVDELPRTEVAPGVQLGIPSDYLEGEKFEQYMEFTRERSKKLKKLYEKHGLRKPTPATFQQNESPKKTSKLLQSLGFGDSWVNAYQLGPNTVYADLFSFTQANFVVPYLDVVVSLNAGGVTWPEIGWPQAYNDFYVSWGVTLPFPTPMCFDIYGDHWIFDGIQVDNFFSSDFDCA